MVTASDLIEELARRADLPHELILSAYGPAPSDFPVHFVRHLPFGADRFGMVGITLRGQVWLLDRLRDRPPLQLLTLLRHEAEHVAQQRRAKLAFYPLYVGEWLLNLLRPGLPIPPTATGRPGRSYAAYRNISYERDAYRAGDTFELAVRRRSTEAGDAADRPDLF